MWELWEQVVPMGKDTFLTSMCEVTPCLQEVSFNKPVGTVDMKVLKVDTRGIAMVYDLSVEANLHE